VRSPRPVACSTFGGNRMSGTLPSYINGMITMSLVGLQDNLFEGE
jgi:hypothetical protein